MGDFGEIHRELQAVLLGPALAPLVGGIAAHYFSWRLLQVGLGGVGLLVWLVTLFIFPETYHPGERGVDKADPATLSKWRPVVLNPFNALWILRSPNMLAVVITLTADFFVSVLNMVLQTLNGFFTLMTDFGTTYC